MIQISKTVFLEMLSLKILNGSQLSKKEFTVTSRKKPSRRKKHYVHQADYMRYMTAKDKQKDEKT